MDLITLVLFLIEKNLKLSKPGSMQAAAIQLCLCSPPTWVFCHLTAISLPTAHPFAECEEIYSTWG